MSEFPLISDNWELGGGLLGTNEKESGSLYICVQINTCMALFHDKHI